MAEKCKEICIQTEAGSFPYNIQFAEDYIVIDYYRENTISRKSENITVLRLYTNETNMQNV